MYNKRRAEVLTMAKRLRRPKEKTKTRRPRKLVLGYLERISSKVFSDYARELTALVGKQHGVYALYKKDRLYYVGLATNLKNRIKQHLKDRHQGKWNRFSLYLVRKTEHLKEIESLLLRIASPRGNAVTGRLRRAENLRTELHSKIRAAQETQIRNLLGDEKRKRAAKKAAEQRRTEAKTRGNGKIPLASYVEKRFVLRATHRGKTYKAAALKSGKISCGGQHFNTPTGAGKVATGLRTLNGWAFWRYRDKQGNWVKLAELRKAKRSD
jgi:hypothetical protein